MSEAKTQWPELTGQDAAAAAETIKSENPSITSTPIVPENSMVTMDYRTDRVRIFVNADQKVAGTPHIG
jgi:predicted phosphoribosyltransferase